jgi:hypothetical protein
MGSYLEKLVLALPIAILICIAINSLEHVNMQWKQVNYAILLICVIWVEGVNLTQVKQQVENVSITSLFLKVLVSVILYINNIIAIYANSPQDLLMCEDGFGALDSKF